MFARKPTIRRVAAAVPGKAPRPLHARSHSVAAESPTRELAVRRELLADHLEPIVERRDSGIRPLLDASREPCESAADLDEITELHGDALREAFESEADAPSLAELVAAAAAAPAPAAELASGAFRRATLDPDADDGADDVPDAPAPRGYTTSVSLPMEDAALRRAFGLLAAPLLRLYESPSLAARGLLVLLWMMFCSGVTLLVTR